MNCLPDTYDVGIIGGGPAGSITALQLARAGYKTFQLSSRSSYTDSIETLAPNPARMLNALGLGHIVSASAHGRVDQTTVRWRTNEPEVLSAADKPALLIDRNRFDAGMRAAAQLAGVMVVESSVHGRFSTAESGWRITVGSGSKPLQACCRFIVDARGRAAAHAAVPASTLPHNAALSHSWLASPRTRHDMMLEAIDDGWIWGARLSSGLHKVEVFLNCETCKGMNASSRSKAVQESMRASMLFANWHPAKIPEGAIRVRDTAARYTADSSLSGQFKAGDASMTIDPISGQGLGIALRSGLQTAAAIATVLAGGNRADALQFYQTARRQTFQQAAQDCGRLYASQTIHQTLYWQSVAPVDPEIVPASTKGKLDDSFKLAPTALINFEPCIREFRIESRAVIVHPQLNRPVATIGHLPVARFASCFTSANTARSATTTLAPDLDSDSARYLLNWCLGRGILESA